MQAYVDVMTYQQVLADGAAQAALHLIGQPCAAWRTGAMLVEVMNKAVLVYDGVPRSAFGLESVCSGAFSRVEPPVTMAGQVCVLEAHGDASVGTGPAECSVLCRADGQYVNVQVRHLHHRQAIHRHTQTDTLLAARTTAACVSPQRPATLHGSWQPEAAASDLTLGTRSPQPLGH